VIDLTNTPTVVPRVMGLAELGENDVVVIKDGESELEAGHWVVLRTAGGKRYELQTRADAPSGADQDGTYVSASHADEIGEDVENPTLRLYNRSDVFNKLRTPAGLVLAATTAVALATAGFGAWFEFAGDTGPSAAATAKKTQKLLAWATEPELGIDADAKPATIAAARKELDRRQRKANDCLEGLRGGDGAPPTVGGVACSAPSPSFLRDKDNAGLITGILGAVAAVFAAIGSAKHLGPGSNPDE